MRTCFGGSLGGEPFEGGNLQKGSLTVEELNPRYVKYQQTLAFEVSASCVSSSNLLSASFRSFNSSSTRFVTFSS